MSNPESDISTKGEDRGRNPHGLPRDEPSSAEPPTPPSASPWRRLMGITYESVILFGVLWFADYAFSALTQFRGEPGILRSVFQGFTTAVLGGYFVFFWSAGRYSLPMKTMSLGVVDHLGSPLSVPRAALRFAAALALPVAALAAGKYLSAWLYLLLPANWLWCLLDRDRQALHDRIAGTRLVYLPFVRRVRSVDV